MFNRFYKFILFILLALLPCTVVSADNSARIARWYKVYWNNVYIADFKVEVGDENLVAQIDSRGLVRKISKYSNHVYSKFHVDKGVYTQEYFESHLKQRQGSKDVKIYYSPSGKIRTEAVVPPDNRSKRPLVEANLKNDAINPLFAAIVARNKIKESLTKGIQTFSFNIYDGRRFSRLEFNISGKENIKILEKKLDVVKINFKRVPIAGFTNNELKRMEGEEPDFFVYLEADTLLPIKADAAAPLGKAHFVFEKECKSLEECR